VVREPSIGDSHAPWFDLGSAAHPADRRPLGRAPFQAGYPSCTAAVWSLQLADGHLADHERRVLAALNPPLNLDGMPPTRLRENLKRERAQIVVVPTAL